MCKKAFWNGRVQKLRQIFGEGPFKVLEFPASGVPSTLVYVKVLTEKKGEQKLSSTLFDIQEAS